MPGLIKISRERNGNFPEYPRKPVDLPLKTKFNSVKARAASFATITIPLIGLYVYAFYAVNKDELLSKVDTEHECPYFIWFVAPVIPFLFTWIQIIRIHTQCFVTQFVDCGMLKSNDMYLIVIPFFLPLMFSLVISCAAISCAVPPISFLIANFVLCSICSAVFLGHWHYAKNHCQCKKCLGLKEVELHYENQQKLMDERTRIDQGELINWFNISTSSNSQLVLQLENGETIHTFTKDSLYIQLKEGHYFICVLELVPKTARSKNSNSKRACAPAPTPIEHLISKENEPKERDETIMNID